MNLEKKNVAVCLILSLITCGIYYLYWVYKMCEQMGELKHTGENDGVKVILLGIITCGIYTMYWTYQTSKDIYYAELDLGMTRVSDNSIINLVLSIFEFHVVAMCIMQASINDVIDELDNPSVHTA